MKNQVQLITYVDRLTDGGISDLGRLLDGPLSDLFGGVHLLPFFSDIDGADAGFDPKDHSQVDSRLGTWQDLQALSKRMPIMADLIVNHISCESPQFLDYMRRGDDSQFANLFLTFDAVFPHGANAADLLALKRPRPGLPFTSRHAIADKKSLFWATFTSSQIDIDVESQAGQEYLSSIVDQFHANGIRAIRLDAAGYAIKRAGTSCFMIPETVDFIDEFSRRAGNREIEVLVEVHADYRTQLDIADRAAYVYDFALPPLLLHTLYSQDTTALKHWLTISPRNCVTVLDTHDGIGIIDVGPSKRGSGLLDAEQIDALVKQIHLNSNDQSARATGDAADNVDLYQVNCTFFDAVGRDARKYLIARALQFFCPGVPQIYYVGLLAGENDMDLLRQSGIGRDINRHRYSKREFEEALEKPVVNALFRLIRLRNSHAAFNGKFELLKTRDEQITIRWSDSNDYIQLTVDAKLMTAVVEYSRDGETHTSNI